MYPKTSITFGDNSTPANAVIHLIDCSNPSFAGGSATVVTTTAASNAPFVVEGAPAGGGVGGELTFDNLANAGSAVITLHGSAFSGSAGGTLYFARGANGNLARAIADPGSTANFAGNAAYGGTVAGSLEGAGNIFLGSSLLSLGSLNTNTTISDVISGSGGRLTKVQWRTNGPNFLAESISAFESLMSFSVDQRRPLGGSGLQVPPIVFGATALANVPQVIPEQRKLEICGEWIGNVEPPVFIDAAYRDGDGLALEVLGRMLRRLEVGSEEVVVHLTLDADRVADEWEKSCRLLGDEYRPKLVSICDPDESARRAVSELKASGTLLGAGIIVRDLDGRSSFASVADWVVLAGGFTVMRHAAEVLAFMTELSRRQIPIIVSGVFEGGFLLGSSRLDGRVPSANDSADRSLLAWRTSFAAVCHGHGVAPAEACIQFALSGPGVVAVLLNSSHPDRVAQSVDFAQRMAPDGFWASMKEEGLLAADYSHLGK